jgi:hypothetical protein
MQPALVFQRQQSTASPVLQRKQHPRLILHRPHERRKIVRMQQLLDFSVSQETTQAMRLQQPQQV